MTNVQIPNALKPFVRGEMRLCHSADEAFKEIQRIYKESGDQIRSAFEQLGTDTGTITTLEDATYPYIAFQVPPSCLNIDARKA